jgi:hypothetical protein
MKRDEVNEEQMCCFLCGFIAPLDDPYTEELMDDGEGFPICPQCGEFNCGGYSTFAPASFWTEDDMADIKSRGAQ